MMFCLLATVALDIFIKEKKQYFKSSLDFFFLIFLCKKCLLGQTKQKGTLLTIPPSSCLLSFTQISTPCLLGPPQPPNPRHPFIWELRVLFIPEKSWYL